MHCAYEIATRTKVGAGKCHVNKASTGFFATMGSRLDDLNVIAN